MKILVPIAISALLGLAPAASAADAAPSAERAALQKDDDKKKDDKQEIVDKRPEIKEMLETLKGHVKARGDEDPEAIVLLGKLEEEYPKSGKRDRKAIIKQVSACIKAKRKPSKEGLIDNKLRLAAAKSLGKMGPESAKELMKWVDHKSFKGDPYTSSAVIKSLGETRVEDAVDVLIDLLPHHDQEVQAAAAAALANYTFLDQKKRKKIFKEVLDEITRVKNMIDVDQVDPIERKRYDVISGPMLRTLQDMSGATDVRDPTKFRSWWNDNKTKDWDKERDKDKGKKKS